jgi:hypothetical protein
LRSQYSLVYSPGDKVSSEYRKIAVAVRRKDLVVRGRDGYYPQSKKQ